MHSLVGWCMSIKEWRAARAQQSSCRLVRLYPPPKWLQHGGGWIHLHLDPYHSCCCWYDTQRQRWRKVRYIYSLRVPYHVETFIWIMVHGHVDQLMTREDSVQLISPALVTMQPAAAQVKQCRFEGTNNLIFRKKPETVFSGGKGPMSRLPLILVNKIIF